MANVLKADTEVADAWAQIDLGSDQSDIWVTHGLYVPAAVVTSYLTAGGSGYFAGLRDSGDSDIGGAYIDGSGWGSFWDAPGPAPVGDTCLLCEIHYVTSGTVDVYLESSLILSGPENTGLDVRFVNAGQTGAFIGPPNRFVYIPYFQIGTTRAGSELFADDFSSGNLSAWTSTFGDVSVVDGPCGYTPIPPPTVTYSRVYGIQITLSDDGVEQVAQLVTSQDGFTT